MGFDGANRPVALMNVNNSFGEREGGGSHGRVSASAPGASKKSRRLLASGTRTNIARGNEGDPRRFGFHLSSKRMIHPVSIIESLYTWNDEK